MIDGYEDPIDKQEHYEKIIDKLKREIVEIIVEEIVNENT